MNRALPHKPAFHDASVEVSKGIAFLTARQCPDGHWEDFILPVGPATSWVTAMIARLLLISGHPDARKAAVRAASWLRTHNQTGRWSYNETIEPDCDSTAWVALLLQELDDGGKGADLDFIRSHQALDGGYSTYIANDAWGQPHACVTPVALLALEQKGPFDPNAMRWLTKQRTENGIWPGYWWTTAFYPTLMASTILTRLAGQAAIPVPDIFAAPELAQIRSALDLACATLIAHLGSPGGALSLRLAGVLGSLQDPDGGWPMSRCLHVVPHWIPPESLEALREHPGECYRDVNRLVSTAFSVAALSVVGRKGQWL